MSRSLLKPTVTLKAINDISATGTRYHSLRPTYETFHACHRPGSHTGYSSIRTSPTVQRSFHWSPAQSISSNPNAFKDSRFSGFRVSTVLSVLLGLGICATGYGLYEFYTSFAIWPEEIRTYLRAGIKAKNQGDLSLSERYLEKAFQAALNLPPSALEPQPYLKLSGIAVVLAEVLENNGLERRARTILDTAYGIGTVLTRDMPVPETLDDSQAARCMRSWAECVPSGQEQLRIAAISYKLGEMFGNAGNEEEELKWLTQSVAHAILAIDSQAGQSNKQSTEKNSETHIVVGELGIPDWMSMTDLAAPLEALGTLYARKGDNDIEHIRYAMTLYQQAIPVLMPEGTASSTEDICHAAQLMNNISELYMRLPPTPEVLKLAEYWAARALKSLAELEVVIRRNNNWGFWKKGPTSKGDTEYMCRYALGVSLFNTAIILEMTDRLDEARRKYEMSLQEFQELGSREGVVEVKQAMKRLQKTFEQNSKNDHEKSQNETLPS